MPTTTCIWSSSAMCILWFDSIFAWDFHVYTWGMVDIDMGMWPQISWWRKEEISRTKNLCYQVVCQPITDILITCNNTPYTRIDVIHYDIPHTWIDVIQSIFDEISFRKKWTLLVVSQSFSCTMMCWTSVRYSASSICTSVYTTPLQAPCSQCGR